MPSQPMLIINGSSNPPVSHPRTTPNLLPCRINHDGPVEPSAAYWSPTSNPDGTKTAYFRGRRLLGKSVPIPSEYVGVVVEKQLPKNDLVDEAGEEEVHLGRLETKAEFAEFVVWGHETVNDAGNDVYTRMEEWIGVAESIHAFGEGEKK